jgi:YD repeat-containing protein
MARIKRLRRIAEKCSRRVADRLAGAINERARALAEQRAEAYGIPLADLLSSKAEMAQDYDQAEKIVSRTFRDGVLVFKPEDLRIDDGIGLKFVGTAEELESMEEAVRRHPAVVGVEREEHRGRYNDINLLVDLQLPEVGTLVDLARDWDWARHAGKGLTPEQLKADFPAFVESGKSTFRAEVILTNHLDLVESEFGSCIHEARILDQRAGQTYSGRIASNASFLIEYMLMMALSPTIEVGELPVKMWGRYLPDVYSMAVWKLFGITLGRDQIDHLVPWGIADVDLLQETRP